MEKSAIDLMSPVRTEQLWHCEKCSFGAVSLWVKRNRVTQIGLRPPYQGKISKRIGLGSTLNELEAMFGAPIAEDEEGNLVVAGVKGLCFAVGPWELTGVEPMDRSGTITEIYVFESQ